MLKLMLNESIILKLYQQPNTLKTVFSRLRNSAKAYKEEISKPSLKQI